MLRPLLKEVFFYTSDIISTMSVIVARHGLSEANDQASLAFGSPNAHLMEHGRVRARELGQVLRHVYQVNVDEEVVATSRLLRTQETAEVAGFRRIVVNSLLDEATTGLSFEEIIEARRTRIAPHTAITVAEAILENPPEQGVWITHGLVIVGLCEVLGIAHQFEKFIPKFCEARMLPIN